MSRRDADGSQTEELDFDQELAKVERSLQELKQRYTQVERDQATQAQLQEQQNSLKQQLKRRPDAAMKAELKQITAQLEELEVNLESRLFTWGSLKESFWQIVRFGGLGIAIGWGLAFVVLRSPQPEPRSNPATPTMPAP